MDEATVHKDWQTSYICHCNVEEDASSTSDIYKGQKNEHCVLRKFNFT